MANAPKVTIHGRDAYGIVTYFIGKICYETQDSVPPPVFDKAKKFTHVGANKRAIDLLDKYNPVKCTRARDLDAIIRRKRGMSEVAIISATPIVQYSVGQARFQTGKSVPLTEITRVESLVSVRRYDEALQLLSTYAPIRLDSIPENVDNEGALRKYLDRKSYVVIEGNSVSVDSIPQNNRNKVVHAVKSTLRGLRLTRMFSVKLSNGNVYVSGSREARKGPRFMEYLRTVSAALINSGFDLKLMQPPMSHVLKVLSAPTSAIKENKMNPEEISRKLFESRGKKIGSGGLIEMCGDDHADEIKKKDKKKKVKPASMEAVRDEFRKERYGKRMAELDEAEVEKRRLHRFFNQIDVGIRSQLRVFYKLISRPLSLPKELYNEMYNVVKVLSKIGTKGNDELMQEFNRLSIRVGDGEIKTGKAYNREANKILKKHGLKKLPYLEHKEEDK